jgi:hypothetical protein
MGAKTPRTETFVLAASATLKIPIGGKYLQVRSCTAASFECSFEHDAFSTFYPGTTYPSRDGFDYIRVRDSLGAGCMLILTFLEELGGDAAGATLAGIAASLVSINQEISGSAAAAVAGQLADTVCAVTPGPATLLFAANVNRTEIEIHAPRTNGAGLIYLGITAARAKAVDKFEVLSAGESWYSDREKGSIYACSSTGAEICNGREC